MKRRTLIMGGLAIAGVAGGTVALWPQRHAAIAAGNFTWTGKDFRVGGTEGVDPSALEKPVFRATPNCIATAAQTLGPCHVNDVPIRSDVSEGHIGLPLRLGFRVVAASDCSPIENADIEIWHTDNRGIYTGREAARMCTNGDPQALEGIAFRGRQVTDKDGVATLISVYPGWYPGRTPHIHCSIVVGGQELLISQVYFDDALSDIIYGQHPDYAGRSERDTRNTDDRIFPADNSRDHIFDFEKLASGVLSATITIGVSA